MFYQQSKYRYLNSILVGFFTFTLGDNVLGAINWNFHTQKHIYNETGIAIENTCLLMKKLVIKIKGSLCYAVVFATLWHWGIAF